MPKILETDLSNLTISKLSELINDFPTLVLKYSSSVSLGGDQRKAIYDIVNGWSLDSIYSQINYYDILINVVSYTANDTSSTQNISKIVSAEIDEPISGGNIKSNTTTYKFELLPQSIGDIFFDEELQKFCRIYIENSIR